MFSQNPPRAAAAFPISRSDPLAAPPLRGDSENFSLVPSKSSLRGPAAERSGSRPESAPFDKLRVHRQAQSA